MTLYARSGGIARRVFLSFMFTGMCVSGPVAADAVTVVNIATINNPDMLELQKLSPQFEKENPDIRLNWTVMTEGVLRERVAADIATSGGQFDLMTIGVYEVPIWAQKQWLVPMTDLPADYDEADLVKTVRDGLSFNGALYALPFYAESSMTYYRKDLFDKKQLTMPSRPTWNDIAAFAARLHDPANGVYGVCLRGRPGWGENMTLIGTIVNAHGGRWFDEKWQPQFETLEWKQAIALYVDLARKYGPPDIAATGFKENLQLFSDGKCAMWIDATVAAGILYRGKDSKVAGKLAFAPAPIATTDKGAHWLWSWSLGVPHSSRSKDAAKKFAIWATSKDYVKLVARDSGWALVPPGTRMSTYASAEYRKVAPFSAFVLDAIQSADPEKPTLKPVPYTGVQVVTIPEFQTIGTFVGQSIASVLTGKNTVDTAMQASQTVTTRIMRQGYYFK